MESIIEAVKSREAVKWMEGIAKLIPLVTTLNLFSLEIVQKMPTLRENSIGGSHGSQWINLRLRLRFLHWKFRKIWRILNFLIIMSIAEVRPSCAHTHMHYDVATLRYPKMGASLQWCTFTSFCCECWKIWLWMYVASWSFLLFLQMWNSNNAFLIWFWCCSCYYSDKLDWRKVFRKFFILEFTGFLPALLESMGKNREKGVNVFLVW